MLYLQYFKIFTKIGWDFWSEVPSLTLGFIAPHVDQESIVRVVGDRDSTMTQYQYYLYFNWLQVYKRPKASRTSSNCQSENTRQNLCIHFKFNKHCSLSHGLFIEIIMVKKIYILEFISKPLRYVNMNHIYLEDWNQNSLIESLLCQDPWSH